MRKDDKRRALHVQKGDGKKGILRNTSIN